MIPRIQKDDYDALIVDDEGEKHIDVITLLFLLALCFVVGFVIGFVL